MTIFLLSLIAVAAAWIIPGRRLRTAYLLSLIVGQVIWLVR